MAGRKRVFDEAPMDNYTIRLCARLARKARIVGEGCMAEGARIALEAIDVTVKTRQTVRALHPTEDAHMLETKFKDLDPDNCTLDDLLSAFKEFHNVDADLNPSLHALVGKPVTIVATSLNESFNELVAVERDFLVVRQHGGSTTALIARSSLVAVNIRF